MWQKIKRFSYLSPDRLVDERTGGWTHSLIVVVCLPLKGGARRMRMAMLESETTKATVVKVWGGVAVVFRKGVRNRLEKVTVV